MTTLEYYSKPDSGFTYFLDFVHGANDCGAPQQIMNLIERKPERNNSLAGGFLVDLGSGPGTSFMPLTKKFGFKQILAVDGAQEMLDFIPTAFPKSAECVLTQCADLEKDRINLDSNVADLAICCSVNSGLSQLDHTFSEASRVLKSGRFFGFNIIVHQEPHFRKVKMESGNDFYAYSMKELLWVSQEQNFSLVESADQPWFRRAGEIRTYHRFCLLEKK